MADFSFNVDTNPMAQSLQRVAQRVDDVTYAVREMQDAVILADKEAADNVCANVNRGFYTLIRSQISQKIAKLKADVESKSMEMVQQSQTLRTFRHRMEQDYVMIARRYSKLFDSLNKSLRQRIFELDKFATHFVHRSVTSMDNRVIHSSGVFIVGSQENVEAHQKLISSNTKGIAQIGIESISKFIIDIKDQKQHISSILVNRRFGVQIIYYIPVIFAESTIRGVAEASFSNYIPNSPSEILNNKLKSVTHNLISSGGQSLKWVETDFVGKERIVSEFGRLVNSSEVSDRLKKETLRLFGECNFRVLR
jgi:hypothetical protein